MASGTAPFRPIQIVLELLEDIDLDADARSLALAAQRLGYRLALNRAVGTELPLSADVLAMTDIIKID